MEQFEQPPQKRGGLFSSKPPAAAAQAVSQDVSNLDRRLRIIEESVTNMKRMLHVTDQNMLTKHKTFSTEFRTLTSDLHEVKKEIAELKDKMISLISELENFARAEQVKVLQKYINMWNPVKFVTQKEVEEMVRDLVAHELRKQNQEDSMQPPV